MQQKELKPIEQIVYLKALTQTMAQKLSELDAFIDAELKNLDLDEQTPLNAAELAQEQIQALLKAYLEEYAAIDDAHRLLKHNALSFIAANQQKNQTQIKGI